jgi:hypothetical protein
VFYFHQVFAASKKICQALFVFRQARRHLDIVQENCADHRKQTAWYRDFQAKHTPLFKKYISPTLFFLTVGDRLLPVI